MAIYPLSEMLNELLMFKEIMKEIGVFFSPYNGGIGLFNDRQVFVYSFISEANNHVFFLQTAIHPPPSQRNKLYC
jgi:hypothetical protein